MYGDCLYTVLYSISVWDGIVWPKIPIFKHARLCFSNKSECCFWYSQTHIFKSLHPSEECVDILENVADFQNESSPRMTIVLKAWELCVKPRTRFLQSSRILLVTQQGRIQDLIKGGAPDRDRPKLPTVRSSVV